MGRIALLNNPKDHAPGGQFYFDETNFPALKLAFHMDDVTSGADSYIPVRYCPDTISVIGNGSVLKDANGFYTETVGSLGATPAFTTLFAGTIVTFQVGVAESGDYKLPFIVGTNSAGGYYINTNAVWRADSAVGTAAAISSPGAPTNGKQGCVMARFTDGAVGTMFYASDFQPTVAFASANGGTAVSGMTGFAPSSALTISSCHTGGKGTAGARCIMAGYMQFETNVPSDAFLMAATRWMAENPGKMYPLFKGME